MEPRQRNIGRAYLAMTLIGVALYLLVRALGSYLQAPAAAAGQGVSQSGSDLSLAQLMIALAVITTASRGLGAICRRWLGQPPVIGEILAGILLGPSLLGAVAPAISGALFPSTVVPALSVVSRVGVVLFMFIIGLEIDGAMLRRSARTTFIVSHASIVAPFVLGSVLALSIRATPPATSVSPRSRCFAASRCRLPPSRCWRVCCASAACNRHPLVPWRWPARRSMMSPPGVCWRW